MSELDPVCIVAAKIRKLVKEGEHFNGHKRHNVVKLFFSGRLCEAPECLDRGLNPGPSEPRYNCSYPRAYTVAIPALQLKLFSQADIEML